MKNYVGLRKDKLLYLPGFQSAKRFGQDRVEYPDYYSNRRMKAKWKGLPPVIHRQQAPLTAGTIALIIIIYPLGDTSVQRGQLSTSVLLLQPLCKFLLIDLAVLALLLFLLRILAPRAERFLRDLSRANPREAAFILAAIDFQQLVLRVTLQVLPHRADLFAGAHHDFFLNALAQRKVDQVVHSRLGVWKEIFVLQHILQGLYGSVCREH